MKKTLIYTVVSLLLLGCASTKKKLQKTASNIFTSEFYNQQFTGFLLIDIEKKDTLVDYNSEKYFTPASNTKIFTLFTALQMLPDSIPALKYITQNDTLFIEGTGDPTFLHNYFDNNVLNFLNGHKNIVLYLNNGEDKKLGPGWAWDDYDYYYQPEKGSFPMYGNVVTLHNTYKLNSIPPYFKDSIIPITFNKNRALNANTFYFSPTRKDTLEIPFRTSNALTKTLLETALNKEVTLTNRFPEGEKKTIYSVPTDSVLKRMMYESDNFLAEQLLILSSSTLSDTLNALKAQEYILEGQLNDLKHPPRWVDGSGLSRYNLFTPESMVHVLSRLKTVVPEKRLFLLFPTWKAPKASQSNEIPFVYAKSGSLGNIYNLSGYLVTNSGKILVFSFMNNHFRIPSAEVKEKMQDIFELIRDTY